MVTPLQSVRGLLLEAAFDPAALKDALSAFARYCGAPIAHLMVADSKHNLLESTFSCELDPAIAAREADYQDVNPRVLAIPNMRQGKSARDKDFIAYDDIAKDQAYQELILPLGLGHFSGVPMIYSSELIAGIALHRPFEDDPFNDEVAQRHERAAAECAPVFELVASVEDLNARNAMDLLGERSAVACVDRTGRIISANEAFDTRRRAGHISIARDGHLQLKRSSEQTRLHRALNGPDGLVTGTFVVTAARGSQRFVCQVLPIPPISCLGLTRAHALLSLQPLTIPPPPPEELVMQAFDLTPAEANVACLLFIGLNLKQISKRRGVSIETTRTMMRRILGKSCCNRQAELVAMMGQLV